MKYTVAWQWGSRMKTSRFLGWTMMSTRMLCPHTTQHGEKP